MPFLIPKFSLSPLKVIYRYYHLFHYIPVCPTPLASISLQLIILQINTCQPETYFVILVPKYPGLPRHKHKPCTSLEVEPILHGLVKTCVSYRNEVLVHVIVPHIKHLPGLIKFAFCNSSSSFVYLK